MAHRLNPIGENPLLEPPEIVRRLRLEFGFVEAYTDVGTDHVLTMIRQFERMKAPTEIIEAHRSMVGRSIRIVVSDRAEFDLDYLVFTAMPNTYPFIGYGSRKHEDAAAPLLERVCKILRYEAVLA